MGDITFVRNSTTHHPVGAKPDPAWSSPSTSSRTTPAPATSATSASSVARPTARSVRRPADYVDFVGGCKITRTFDPLIKSLQPAIKIKVVWHFPPEF